MFNIYLICAEIDVKKLYNIGYTRRTIQERIREFRTGNASEFYIVDSFQSKWGTKIEAMLHRQYRQRKINGEWFDLSESDINEFKSSCQSIHNNFELLVNNNSYVIGRGGRF